MNEGAAGLRVAIVSRRVHPAHGPGGLEKHVHDQVRELAAAGVRVDVYCERPTDDGRAARAESEAATGVRFYWVDRGPLPIGKARGTVVLDRLTNYPLWAYRVASRLAAPPDIVHVHGLAGLGLVKPRRRHGAPMVLTPHGMEEFRSPGWLKHGAYAPFRRGIRRIAAASDRVIATDEVLVSIVREQLRVADDRIVVIPNAIDPDECTRRADVEAARRTLASVGAVDNGPLLVSVGRIAPNKGFEVLAEALGQVSSKLPAGWRWVLVGDGPDRPRVEAAVARAGIGASTALLGQVDDRLKHGLLAVADWFVHPTLYEGSSLVTLEAMAHRLPVVASRAGGLPDKVQEGTSGYLVEPGDAGQLGVALERALACDGGALGAAGRALLDERFSWAAVGPLYLRLYEKLAGRMR